VDPVEHLVVAGVLGLLDAVQLEGLGRAAAALVECGDEANAKLARNPGVIASFSRALTEGLSAQQSDAEFDETLDAAIKSIYEASIT
jgi:hypothetical protein